MKDETYPKGFLFGLEQQKNEEDINPEDIETQKHPEYKSYLAMEEIFEGCLLDTNITLGDEEEEVKVRIILVT